MRDVKRAPTYAPLPRHEYTYAQSGRLRWQLRAWQEATGRETPQCVYEPLMPHAEAEQVLDALGRKRLELWITPEFMR